MDYNADRKHVVNGRIVSSLTKEPLAGVHVTVLDKDLFDDDILGSGLTDEAGKFEVSFLEKDYASGATDAFESGPDIYLIIEEAQSIGKPFLVGAMDDLASLGGLERYRSCHHVFETEVLVHHATQRNVDVGTVAIPWPSPDPETEE